MRSIHEDIVRWRADGRSIALGRVVGVEGSGPRETGSAMAVNDAGEVAGSVSGGCVEGAVVTEALSLLEGDRRPRLCSFGYSDDDAFAVGLTCGGTVRVFLEDLEPFGLLFDTLQRGLEAGEPAALAEVVEGPEELLGAKLLVGADDASSSAALEANPGLRDVVVRDTRGALESGRSETRHYGRHGEARGNEVAVFIESFVAPPKMVIFGAVDFTAALGRVAKVLGYRVIVCDPRPTFATALRFPMADEIVVDWPDRYLAATGDRLTARDAVCVLTHDAKFDVPALIGALATDVGYIGAMGSRRTHAARVERLRDEGADDKALAKVMAPIGLDLGARTPEETAVSICAEIIAKRSGRDASSLRDSDGPIHTSR